MQFDQDTIKELAVYSVQQFISNQVPLDESIAEKARALQLNEDQVRRVVESTNVIAFLKLREGASDKTFEFEVASFPGVMNALMGSGTSRGYVDVTTPEPSLEKAAFDVSAEVPEDQSHQTLYKAHAHARAELEKVAQEHYNCVSDLERFVPALVKQAYWQERLECAAGSDFDRIMTAFGKSGFEKSASLANRVFVGKELEVANHVVDLIKQAAEFQGRKANLEEMEKKAFLALAARALGGLARGSLGVAKSFAKDPLAGAAAAATAIPAAAAGLGLKAAKGATKTFKRSAIGLGALTTAAITSATYTPKTNQRTGRPNDVLNNIYE